MINEGGFDCLGDVLRFFQVAKADDWLKSECERCSIRANTVYLIAAPEENTNELCYGLEGEEYKQG